MDRLDELVSNTVSIALFYGLHHISSLLTSTVDNQVITFLHALPTLITVHRIETTYDRSDSCVVVGANLSNLLDEALTTLGVCITTVHETVNERLVLQTIVLTYLNEFEQVFQRRVYTTIRAETHQVQFLIVLLGIGISGLHLRILYDRTILAGTVNLHKVLINDAAGTDIEVSYLRVTHLSVRQTYILTRSLKLRVSRCSCQQIKVRCWSIENHITLTMLTDSPSIENHQKCFLCHNKNT